MILEHAPAHTRDVFDIQLFPAVVDWVISVARQEQYDALAASGHSGLLVAGAAAYILQIPVLAVRKEGDVAKGDSSRVNAILVQDYTPYAFVDDLIGTGGT